MKKFKLEKVRCLETEDTGSRDEMRIDIFVDSKLQLPPIRKKMDNPEVWNLNRSFLFDKRFEVQIWDEDRGDEDDLIGRRIFRGHLRSHARQDYTEDGGHYRIIYSIEDAAGARATSVQAAIDRFDRSDLPGVWPNIDKSVLIADLRTNIGTALLAKQAFIPLCGPASIVYELSRQNPVQYVRICQQLYEHGYFDMRTKRVQPSRTLRESPIGDNTRAGGWIVMASLRDVANAICDVDEDPSDVSGGTSPWEMKMWAFELLGYNWVDVKSLHLDYGEMDAMRRADRVWQRGGVAFLAVNDDLARDNPGGWDRTGNHMISYAGGLNIDEAAEKISFKFFTWGEIKSINVAKNRFKHQTWHIIYGASRRIR